MKKSSKESKRGTAEQLGRERARFLLGCMKPFNEWLEAIDLDTIATVRRTFGDPAVFYQRFVKELFDLAGTTQTGDTIQ